MSSMLEVLREYKHLTAKKKKEGTLPPSLEERLVELQGLVKANAPQRAEAEEPRVSAATPEPRIAPSSTPVERRPATRAVSGPGRSAPRAASPAPAEPLPRATSVKRKPKKLTGIELLLAYLPKSQKKLQLLLWSMVMIFFLLGLGAAIIFGVSLQRALDNLLPSMTLIGGVGWGGFYPLLMYWRERVAAKSDAHLHQPSFEAKAPMVEPVVAMLVLLAAAVWLMVSGYTSEGIGPIVGYLIGMACGLFSVAAAAILIVRPVFVRKAHGRAFQQYIDAGDMSLEKNNPKRARRMFENALGVAKDESQTDRAVRLLRNATAKEAEELRQKGLHDQAEKLIEAIRQKEQMQLVTGWGAAATTSSSEDEESSSAMSVKDVLATTTPPQLLEVGTIRIEPSPPSTSDPDSRAALQRAEILAKRGREREAIEILVAAELPVTPEIARAAAKLYVSQGVLRSADALYAALGEEQIPEFYKAVAIELSKSNEGNPPAHQCLRLIEILTRMNELKSATQLACRGALSTEARGGDQQKLGRLAIELCSKVGAEPPPEVLEALGQVEAAARAYEAEGRPEEAKRCYFKLADKLLANAGPQQYIPILSKLFLTEEKNLDDKYLTPLAEQAANAKTLSPASLKILQLYRKRHPEDRKMGRRLFDLYVQSGKLEDALAELDELQKNQDSTSAGLIESFQALVAKFPSSLDAHTRLIFAQLRRGKINEAVQGVHRVMALPEAAAKPQTLIQVLDALFEWGHVDPELQKEAALLKMSLGDRAGALDILESYVLNGGKDPEAIQHVESALREQLVSNSGGPSHDGHMRLARFFLHRGTPEEAIPLLEVCRSSTALAFESDVLIARAHLAASNPRIAVDFLRAAIAGRGLSETPELHFELARAYEEVGQLKAAQKIDDALDLAIPGFRKRYTTERAVFSKADTEWIPPEHDPDAPAPSAQPRAEIADLTSMELDTGIDPAKPSFDAAKPSIMDPAEGPMDLEDVLAPRYKLKKRVGSGGMGDVHMAEDLVLGRKVAIKVLRRTLATDLFLAKFREEARIVAQLTHPGIVQVYDIGQRSDWAYIVMEYVNGPNLATLVSAATPPTRPQLINILADVADAMGYAHKRSVIHRDLKPANILVAADGTSKVTDFGIAHVLQGEGGEETAFSAAGMQVGTVNYMAPEQIKGLKIDPRTDIYLLGTTLYYCLCGKYPYSGDAVVVMKLRSDPTPIDRHTPTITPDLAKIVMKCIARDPKDRFQSMEEVAQRLRRLPDATADQRTELL
jgi:tetratricopeptide (TPR) repeat protein/predicted Ser/Thr protein kinase